MATADEVEVQLEPSEPQGEPQLALEGEELMSALKPRLEYWFSRENLSNDAYLVSQMNGQKFVPVDVIMRFPKVKSLTSDKDVVIKAMTECKNLVLDETQSMVRPNFKMERTTLILRDIPSTTQVEEIKSIFERPECPAAPVNVRGDIGDTWFVQFKSEAECTDTALWLSSQSFQDNPILCRIKSENLVRGFYYPMGPNGPHPDAPGAWRGGYPGAYPGFNQYPTPNFYSGFPPNPGFDPRNNRTPSIRKPKGNPPPTVPGKGKKAPKPKGPSRSGAKDETVEFGLDNFPALPTQPKKPEVGYKKIFRKFERERMAEIVDDMCKQTFPPPETFPKDGVITNKQALQGCQLLEPMPVMYPASPSPLLAALPHHSSQMPLLDLDYPHLPPDYGSSVPTPLDIQPTKSDPAPPKAKGTPGAYPKRHKSKPNKKKEDERKGDKMTVHVNATAVVPIAVPDGGKSST